MKKSKLNFKVLTGTLSRCQQIINALLDKGFLEAKDIRVDNKVILCDGGDLICSFQPESIEDRKNLPEVTFRQALDLIWEVEPEPQEAGEFVEFNVDEKGFFSIDEHAISAHWQSTMKIAELTEGEFVFAGWKWADKDDTICITATIMGLSPEGRLLNHLKKHSLSGWVKPAQPVAVRFWRKK